MLAHDFSSNRIINAEGASVLLVNCRSSFQRRITSVFRQAILEDVIRGPCLHVRVTADLARYMGTLFRVNLSVVASSSGE